MHTLTTKYLKADRLHLSECSCGDWAQYSPHKPLDPHLDHQFHVKFTQKESK